MRRLLRRALPALLLAAAFAGCGKDNEPAKLPDNVPPPPKGRPMAGDRPAPNGAPAKTQVEDAPPPVTP